MVLGQRGFDLITEFETLELKSYLDQAGVWTIGYGTTMLNGYPVTKGMEINEAVANALFHGDVENTIRGVRRTLIAPDRLNQHQSDALISLAYNIGLGGFSGSTLVKIINTNDDVWENLFTRWNRYTDSVTKKKKVSNGLTRRRQAEYKLFMTPVR